MNREFHKYHIETYFDTFKDEISKRNSDDEVLSYLQHKIEIEEKRLNRYLVELRPDLYTDHRIYIDDIETIIQKLKNIKQELFPEKKTNEAIKLNYGTFNEKVIETLYNGLYPEKIDVMFDDFKIHFLPNHETILIRWKGSEPQIAYLFKKLKIENTEYWQLISNHFLNKKNVGFNPKQLSVVYDKSLSGFKDKQVIDNLISSINNISKS